MSIQEEIKEILKQIVEKYKPERVILFGSGVKGEFSKDSDLDFLIIKEEVPPVGRERARELRRMIEKKVAVDFLIYRPEEFETRVRIGDPFLKAILKEGKVLYSA